MMESFVPRARFALAHKPQWFPGHMHKGIRDIGRVLKRTSCIFEVHDARIPFSGRNLQFIGRLAQNKPVILLLNKADLIDPKHKPLIKSKLETDMKKLAIPIEDVLFMDSICGNAKMGGYNQKLMSTIINAIQKSPSLVAESDLFDEEAYNLLILGVPNVGKSTVINRLRNVYLGKSGKATTTGAQAGVTRALLERIKICDFPRKIYLFDTPGVLEPSFHHFKTQQDKEAFLRCAACGTMSDSVIGKELIADYLLYWLNKHNNFKYVELFGLPHPTNNIMELFTYGAVKFGYTNQVKAQDTGKLQYKANTNAVADKFILTFRKGQFGYVSLDCDEFL